MVKVRQKKGKLNAEENRKKTVKMLGVNERLLDSQVKAF